MPRPKKYVVALTDEERLYLLNLLKQGEMKARMVTRARILLLSVAHGVLWKRRTTRDKIGALYAILTPRLVAAWPWYSSAASLCFSLTRPSCRTARCGTRR
ncbi:MAG: hypothetical protein KatS3mg049_2325 [Caldilinea sp.]|jgi:hypothetical protein|nr:MAG: hypothetical protein KatS3mg049_2325 [Caldilinea sp.]